MLGGINLKKVLITESEQFNKYRLVTTSSKSSTLDINGLVNILSTFTRINNSQNGRGYHASESKVYLPQSLCQPLILLENQEGFDT